jgi:hypothetical protein
MRRNHTEEGKGVKRRTSLNPDSLPSRPRPAFLLRREAVPTRVALTEWLANHLRLTTEPGQEDRITIVDGLLTDRGAVRVYTSAQIGSLDRAVRPSVSVSLGDYVITLD